MEKLTIYTHGAAKENPGPAAVGVQVLDIKGAVVLELSETIGNATNDYAQYYAVVRAFQVLKEKFGDKTRKIEFELRLDSELVRNHLCAEAQIKDVGLIGHFIEIYNMRVESFPGLTITQVKSGSNTNVEKLVKGALDV